MKRSSIGNGSLACVFGLLCATLAMLGGASAPGSPCGSLGKLPGEGAEMPGFHRRCCCGGTPVCGSCPCCVNDRMCAMPGATPTTPAPVVVEYSYSRVSTHPTFGVSTATGSGQVASNWDCNNRLEGSFGGGGGVLLPGVHVLFSGQSVAYAVRLRIFQILVQAGLPATPHPYSIGERVMFAECFGGTSGSIDFNWFVNAAGLSHVSFAPQATGSLQGCARAGSGTYFSPSPASTVQASIDWRILPSPLRCPATAALIGDVGRPIRA